MTSIISPFMPVKSSRSSARTAPAKARCAKILYGYYRADAGEIRVSGRPASISSPHDARRYGIGMVFQNFSLIPALSVWENVALFLDDTPWAISPASMRRRMRPLADRLRLEADLNLPVGRLAVGDQQKVEILKQLLAGARVLIFDEPTKVLAPQEAEGLFLSLADLSDEGYGVVYITHKLREVAACADRVVVMRQGRIVGSAPAREASEAELLGMMFGEAPAREPAAAPAVTPGQTLLALEGVATSSGNGAVSLRDLTLELRSGEILGVAGVSGNGQRELADLVLGLARPTRGVKTLWGEDASRWTAAKSGARRRQHPRRSVGARARAFADRARESRPRRRQALSQGPEPGLAAADRRHGQERRAPPPAADPLRNQGLCSFRRQSAAAGADARARARAKLIVALYPYPRARRAQYGRAAGAVSRGARGGRRSPVVFGGARRAHLAQRSHHRAAGGTRRRRVFARFLRPRHDRRVHGGDGRCRVRPLLPGSAPPLRPRGARSSWPSRRRRSSRCFCSSTARTRCAPIATRSSMCSPTLMDSRSCSCACRRCS